MFGIFTDVEVVEVGVEVEVVEEDEGTDEVGIVVDYFSVN